MKRTLAALALVLVLAGCQATTDVFCKTHTASDFRPTQATFLAMTVDQRRKSLEILREGSNRCGWKSSD